MASITQIVSGTLGSSWSLDRLVGLDRIEFGLASKVTVENSGLLCQKLGGYSRTRKCDLTWRTYCGSTLVQQKGRLAGPTEMS